MLHSNFQGHLPFGSGEEDLLRFLPYIGMVVILVMWPGPFKHSFVPPSHGGSVRNLTLIGQAVSEEKMFKECGRWWRTDNRACLYYKLTYESKGSGELKSNLKPYPNPIIPTLWRLLQSAWFLTYEKVYFVKMSCLMRNQQNDCAPQQWNHPRFYACPRYLQVWGRSDQKWMCYRADIIFSIINLWKLSVAMETRILIQSAPKPYAAFTPPQ